MLPLQVRVDLGAMVMRGYSIFPKAPALLEPHHQIVYRHMRDTCWWGSYPSAEKQPVYSTALTDWAPCERNEFSYLPSYGLNSITAFLLQGWLWHQINYKDWYAIKQTSYEHKFLFILHRQNSLLNGLYMTYIKWKYISIITFC